MYIAVLDYANLDNPLFLKTFANALAQRGAHKALIIHNDSAYTERLIQTGMMRDQAQQRSNQDLNHRIVSFFADYGLACIGLNGYQRNTVTIDGPGTVCVNKSFLDSLPEKTLVVLSCLALNTEINQKTVIPTAYMMQVLREQLDIQDAYVFSTLANDQILHENTGINTIISARLQDYLNLNKTNGIPDEFKKTDFHFIFCKPLYNNDMQSFVKICDILP
jgi:hypothetical protein